MVSAKIIFYLRKVENGETSEGGICRERESRKKNGEMRWALLEHGKQEVAYSAFIMLCFRENIFLIFEEFSGKGRRRGRSDQRRRKESVRAKGDTQGREKRRDRQERRSTAFLSPKRIYFSFAR